MASLQFNLKDRVLKKQYQFITFNGCVYFPGFNLVNKKTQKINKGCNNQYHQTLKETLSNEKNSIFIFGGRFPLYLTNYRFDNKEGGVEGGEWTFKYLPVGKYDTIQNSFKNENWIIWVK